MTRKGDFSTHVKKLVRERANWTCELPGCDRSAIDVDHKRPLWQGGTNALDNAQLLCKKHHDAKTAKEAPERAKCDRQSGRKGQYARRKRAKEEGRHKGIQGGGFKKPDGYVSPLNSKHPNYRKRKVGA